MTRRTRPPAWIIATSFGAVPFRTLMAALSIHIDPAAEDASHVADTEFDVIPLGFPWRGERWAVI